MDFSLLEQAHDLFLRIGVHAAVQDRNIQVGKYFLTQLAVHLHRGLEFRFFVFLDHGIHDIGLMSGCSLLAHKLPDFVRTLVSDAAGDNGGSSRRHFVEHADVEVAVKGERESARDGGRGHDENVGLTWRGALLRRAGEGTRPHMGIGSISALLHQLKALHHTKAMLLVHNYEAELGEIYLLLDYGVSANHVLRVALRNVPSGLALAVIF